MKSSYDRFLKARSGVTVSLLGVGAILLVGVVLISVTLQDPNSLHQLIDNYVTARGKLFVPSSVVDGSVGELINDIREAVKAVANGADVTLSAADREAWEEMFPCRSRVELDPFYKKRKHVQYVPVSEKWQRVLNEYAVLHRICMERVGDLSAYIASQNQSTGCKFVVAEAHYGLGNKILHMSSLLVYAVLTKRVLLIPGSTVVPYVTCEPFEGSSWTLADDVHHRLTENRIDPDKLFGTIDENVAAQSKMDVYAAQGGGVWGPHQRFWCDAEQNYLSSVTWLTFDGCLHHLPRLFSVAQFRPVLEEMFPRRIVLTHVLRTAMLPADPVWKRTVRADKVHMANADKRVGVQVRFLLGSKQYDEVNMPVNEHITRCMWEKGLLPELCPPKSDDQNEAPMDGKFSNCSSPKFDTDSSVTKVVIASLVLSFNDYLSNLYLRRETVNRETVGIVQLSHDQVQGKGVEEDTQALVEVLVLSFSDILLVTPFSTFGGLAQAYGTLVPYFIEYNPAVDVPCQRAISTEPCALGSSPTYDCRYDPTQHQHIRDFVPYLQRCLNIDVGEGYSMQLMNKE